MITRACSHNVCQQARDPKHRYVFSTENISPTGQIRLLYVTIFVPRRDNNKYTQSPYPIRNSKQENLAMQSGW